MLAALWHIARPSFVPGRWRGTAHPRVKRRTGGARVGLSGAVRPTQRLPHHVVHRGTGMMLEDGVTGEGPRQPSRQQSCLLPTVLASEAYQSEVAFSGMLHQNSCKRVYSFKQGESLTRKWQRLSQTEFCCSFENNEAAHSGSYDEPEAESLAQGPALASPSAATLGSQMGISPCPRVHIQTEGKKYKVK